MFRYGLVGNIATYGGIAAIFAYVGINILIKTGYELNNIIEISPKIDDELASQVLNSSKSPNISIDAKNDMRRAAAKQILQDYQRKKKDPVEVFEQIEQKQSRNPQSKEPDI
ncbi:unnamed protein product (macronuclear) [Paramecium tetraurelia]|uniref:Uncharacterized protein n=1 Tax=Paramecium tetraurelia TaxID=5888 RepID=A0BTF4_PARTE|nr:uncharacterized protein GSPATT00032053001 [Paramecium tetraurelia]CAK61821.1 unnamed protein product [Paramecium tetraurelia]|eukprot:XP_001429219.1 hypothetical protein (macronuclear) [Paramecium tetraurelia strain d4-2]